MNELYEKCKSDIAKKYKLGKTLVIGHLPKYYEEAAMLYAEQVKSVDLADVVGRSEQFICYKQDFEDNPKCDNQCQKCREYECISK